MTQFDVAALALLAAFGYSGYRRGLLVFVLHLTGGVLAFALAAVLAPLLAPQIARMAHLPLLVAQPAAVIGLTAALRVVFGFAVRELATALRTLIGAIPPLAFLDRLLGIVPGLAIGALFVVAVTVAAVSLPVGRGVHDAAESSWVARNVVARPDDVLATARRLWDGLVVNPPRLGMLPLGTGVAGLWLAAFAAHRLRVGQSATPQAAAGLDFTEAPTRRAPYPVPDTSANATDPLALPRLLLGMTTAGLLMAVLVTLSRLRG